MRNLSAAQTECSAKVMAHNGCLSGAHLWILGWEATFLCSGRTSFISGSDRVIGEHAIAFATLALSPSALLPRSTSRAASACPPTHTLPPYFTPLISCSLYLWCPRSCGYNEADCEGRRETTAAALRICAAKNWSGHNSIATSCTAGATVTLPQHKATVFFPSQEQKITCNQITLLSNRHYRSFYTASQTGNFQSELPGALPSIGRL